MYFFTKKNFLLDWSFLDSLQQIVSCFFQYNYNIIYIYIADTQGKSQIMTESQNQPNKKFKQNQEDLLTQNKKKRLKYKNNTP